MQIIHLNDTTFAAGKAAFESYAAAALCGPGSSAYDASMWRETGPRVLVGAIMACIERGLANRDEIVDAAARVSRCRRSTVETMLDSMDGVDPALHLWTSEAGRYEILVGDLTRVPVLLAA